MDIDVNWDIGLDRMQFPLTITELHLTTNAEPNLT